MRPALGAVAEALDRVILHRVVAATVRNFLSRVAADITGQPSPAEPGSGAASQPWAPEMS